MKRICLFTAWIFLNTVVKSGAQINPHNPGAEPATEISISPKGINLINIKGRHWARAGKAALPALPHNVSKSAPVKPDLYFGRSIGMHLPGTAHTAEYEKDMHRLQNSVVLRTSNSVPDAAPGIDIPLGKNASLNLGLGYYDGPADPVKDPIESYDTGQDANMNISLLFAIK